MDTGISTYLSSQTTDVAALAQRAESAGFESFWLPEHPVVPVNTTSRYGGTADGSIPAFMNDLGDPLIGLAAASGSTHRIRLGTAISLVPEHNPLLQAKQIATLDLLSSGRFVFGIGAGWLKEETEIMGGDFERRWSQTREAVSAMKELWTKDEAEFHGRFYDFPPVRCSPKPIQKPHPPVLLGGVDRFGAKTLSKSLQEREGWSARLLGIDEHVTRIITELRERGFRSPYLRNLVVARINPVRWHRAKKGETKPPMALGAALTRMSASARKFDAGSVRERDLALVAAVVDSA